MIKSITVTNHLAESLTLDLTSPEKSGFAIRKIDGLGAGKANINTSQSALMDGSSFNSAKINTRNIVLDLCFLPNPSIEDTRQKTYKFFPIKKKIKLMIETDNRICEIYGYVEANEPTIFSEQQGSQISILCPDPYFYSTGTDGVTVTVFAGVDPQFVFPFSNNSLTTKLLKMGDIVTNQQQSIVYDGDADIGITIFIHALGVAGDVTVYNANTQELMKINSSKLVAITGSGLKAGDDIIINTVRGNKNIQLLRDGVYTNILNSLSKNTDWITIVKGDNVLTFVASSGATNLQYRIENQTIYEGV